MRKLLMAAAVVFLCSCSGPLPKLSVTPVDAELTVGGTHDTQHAEDSMMKVQTGDTSTSEYVAGTVEQVYNDIEEYPLWLVIAFALSVPSPIHAIPNWFRNRRLRRQLDALTKAVEENNARTSV